MYRFWLYSPSPCRSFLHFAHKKCESYEYRPPTFRHHSPSRLSRSVTLVRFAKAPYCAYIRVKHNTSFNFEEWGIYVDRRDVRQPTLLTCVLSVNKYSPAFSITDRFSVNNKALKWNVLLLSCFHAQLLSFPILSDFMLVRKHRVFQFIWTYLNSR